MIKEENCDSYNVFEKTLKSLSYRLNYVYYFLLP